MKKPLPSKDIPNGMSFEYVKRKTVCTISSARTVIRIAPAPAGKITHEWLYGCFPYGNRLNENTHVFSYEVFKSVVFMAALPVELALEALNICEGVHMIDVYERRLFKKNCGKFADLRLCFPLGGGWRILDISEGLPANAYFVSSHPDYRKDELERLEKPKSEILLLEECEWLSDYFMSKGYVCNARI